MSDATGNLDFNRYSPRQADTSGQESHPNVEAPFRLLAQHLYLTIAAIGACVAHVVSGTGRRFNAGLYSLYIAWAVAGLGWGIVLGWATWPLVISWFG